MRFSTCVGVGMRAVVADLECGGISNSLILVFKGALGFSGGSSALDRSSSSGAALIYIRVTLLF